MIRLGLSKIVQNSKLMKMSYTRKVAYSTVAQMVGKIIGTGVSLVTVALLFRYFGIDGIGRYTTVFAFVGFFSVLADFGLQWTLIRELTVDKDKSKVFHNIFSFRLLTAVILYSLAFALVWFFHYPYEVKLGVGLISLATLFSTINSTLVSVYINNFRLDITVSADVVGRAVTLGLIYLVVRAGGGFGSAMATYIGGNLVTLMINFYLLGNFIDFGLGFDFKYWRHAIRQSVPIGIVMIFGFIYYKIDSVMLSVLKSMTDVGIYGTAYKVLEILQTIPVMFLGAAFPLVTRYVTQGDERAKTAFQKSFDFLILLAVPTVVIFFLLAGPIISFIAGAKGGEFINESTVSFLGHAITSVTTMKILIISVGINFVSSLYIYMVISLGRQKNAIIPTLAIALFNLALNFLLIPKFSYLGAATSTLLTELVVLMAYSWLTRRFIHLPIKLGTFFKLIFIGILMAILTIFLINLNLNMFIVMAAGLSFYVILVFVFKAIPIEMVKDLINKGEK